MRSLLAITAGTFAVLLAPPLRASTATANLTVTVTVSNNCQLSTTSVGFGTYDPLFANLANPQTAPGRVTLACTGGTAASVGLGLGGNPLGETRRMRGGASFISYELYQPPNTSPGASCSYATPTVWGSAGGQVFTLSAAPSRLARSYNVCGRIPAAQDVPAASYADTVVATVNF